MSKRGGESYLGGHTVIRPEDGYDYQLWLKRRRRHRKYARRTLQQDSWVKTMRNGNQAKVAAMDAQAAAHMAERRLESERSKQQQLRREEPSS